MSSSDVTPSSLGERKTHSRVDPRLGGGWMPDLRDALQRAHDGESPDSIMEEIREEPDACPCLENGRCSWVHTGYRP